jgi:hypothetical protein
MIGFLQKTINQLRRVVGAEPAPSPEPKSRGGRPKKNTPVEELRAAAAKRSADYRDRKRQKEEEEQRKKAEQRTVGQLVQWQDSAGHRHVGGVQAIDAEGHAIKREEIARDESGNPRKWGNGHWMFLKEVDDDVKPVVSNPAPVTPSPVQQPVQRKPEPAPEPIDNADSFGALWASRYGGLDFKPDITQFFLVSSVPNVESASRMGQLAVSIPRRHPDYDEKFLPVSKIWVVVTRSDEVWLRSLLTASPEIQAKMRLCVCDDIQALLSLKLSTDIAVLRKQPVTVEGFYSTHFISMPQDAGQVDALLAPPPTPEHVQSPQPWDPGVGTGYLPPSGWKPKPPSGSNSGGTDNDGSSCCM